MLKTEKMLNGYILKVMIFCGCFGKVYLTVLKKLLLQ